MMYLGAVVCNCSGFVRDLGVPSALFITTGLIIVDIDIGWRLWNLSLSLNISYRQL
jgi:hypothetical protein